MSDPNSDALPLGYTPILTNGLKKFFPIWSKVFFVYKKKDLHFYILLNTQFQIRIHEVWYTFFLLSQKKDKKK